MIFIIIGIGLSVGIVLLSISIIGLNKKVADLEMEKIHNTSVENKPDKTDHITESLLNLEISKRISLEFKNRELIVENVLTAINKVEECFNETDIKITEIELHLHIVDKCDKNIFHTVKAQSFYQCGVFAKIYLQSISDQIKEIDFDFDFEFEKGKKK